MTPGDEKPRGLTRERLVEAALELIKEEGLDGLSMRALADRLDVKAASLYWHVRDRRELLELLADGILHAVRPAGGRAGWRQAVFENGRRLAARVAGQRDAARILLEVPEAFERSDVFAELKRQLAGAGLQAVEAADVASMVMVHVISDRAPVEPATFQPGSSASIAIDSGSRGVLLRAGDGMQTLVRAAHDQNGVAPGVVRGETVVVRRLRGVGMGELELDPRRSWRFKVQAPTWNTVIDAGALDVREIHIDSGATKVECFLPMPRGVVPIHISSGVVDVALHRPRGAAVTAVVHTGAVRVKLDDYSSKVVVSDVHWRSADANAAPDRYELDVSSGAVKVSLDEAAKAVRPVEQVVPPMPADEPVSALEILLDGVEARVRSRA
jgi:TetR/AcrR family transcriptional regulator, tetracycline repressor protein